MADSTLDYLGKVPLFQGLDKKHLQRVAQLATRLDLPEGKELIRQGEAGHEFVIVLNGELFHGDGFGAGEIGHTTVADDGAECHCGRFGCLETVASSRAQETGACSRSQSTRNAKSERCPTSWTN